VSDFIRKEIPMKEVKKIEDSSLDKKEKKDKR
jgi:hypothetical protein